jgi:hypothetical protein
MPKWEVLEGLSIAARAPQIALPMGRQAGRGPIL